DMQTRYQLDADVTSAADQTVPCNTRGWNRLPASVAVCCRAGLLIWIVLPACFSMICVPVGSGGSVLSSRSSEVDETS
ncbi:MAG: hypothetical protein PHP40_06600, partial [Eubacteriales bacterium]|nr:hypothetical protein [Eubacteriales bacterium]